MAEKTVTSKGSGVGPGSGLRPSPTRPLLFFLASILSSVKWVQHRQPPGAVGNVLKTLMRPLERAGQEGSRPASIGLGAEVTGSGCPRGQTLQVGGGRGEPLKFPAGGEAAWAEMEKQQTSARTEGESAQGAGSPRL